MLGDEPHANLPLAAWGLLPILTGPSTVAIIVEDGLCVLGANSYADNVAADLYFTNRSTTSTWFNLTASQKDIALIESTTMMEAAVQWLCGTASCVGGLKWPRIGGKYPNGTDVPEMIVPEFVKFAQFELAFLAMNTDLFAFLTTPGKYEKVGLGRGALSVEFVKTRQDFIARLPDWWWGMLGPCARRVGAGQVGIALVGR